LQISIVDGYQPKLGDSFQVLDYSSLAGSFNSVQILNNPQDQFTPEYGADGLTLTVTAVPEPASFGSVLMASLLALCRHQRCRRRPNS
jgi:hypothetical protein